MNADLTSFYRPVDAGWRVAPDFGALVAFLAAAQASQPTARAAVRLDSRSGEAGEIVPALIAVFAPRRGIAATGAMLEGRFNPVVPISDAPVTRSKPL